MEQRYQHHEACEQDGRRRVMEQVVGYCRIDVLIHCMHISIVCGSTERYHPYRSNTNTSTGLDVYCKRDDKCRNSKYLVCVYVIIMHRDEKRYFCIIRDRGYVGTAIRKLRSPDCVDGRDLQQVMGQVHCSMTIGQYVYLWQNYSPLPATWTITVSVPLIWGNCPLVMNVSTGFTFNSSTWLFKNYKNASISKLSGLCQQTQYK